MATLLGKRQTETPQADANAATKAPVSRGGQARGALKQGVCEGFVL